MDALTTPEDTPRIDVLAVGELLVDFISERPAATLAEAETFRRVQGGSPANLAGNVARLGHRAALVACVGDDGPGRFAIEQVAARGVMTRHIATTSEAPTTLVLVARTAGTPDFVAYRGADRWIEPAQLDGALIARSRIYHTTCFALSREPARGSILAGARRATEAGCTLSLDANYAPSIGPARRAAQRIVAEYCAHGALVKISRDDVERLFGAGVPAEDAVQRVHGWGARLVVLTLGGAGSLVSWDGGQHQARVRAPQTEAIDATGAGDAYWAGFLVAWLDGRAPAACARAGARLAARKLAHPGPLTDPISKAALYASGAG